MEINQLKERIDAVDMKLVKTNKRIVKWSRGLSDKDIEMAHLPYSQENNKLFEDYCKSRSYQYYSDNEVQGNIYELRNAYDDLHNQQVLLDKYQNALTFQIARSQVTKIQIIVDFLNNWKAQVVAYIKRDVLRLVQAYGMDTEICNKHNSGWYRQHPEADEDKDYHEYRELMNSVNPITKDCYSRQSINNLDMQKLDEFLEKEKEAKYWDLIDRITEVAGEIQDASCLRIGEKGEINGLIQGSKAKVHVETIGAGGYNEGIIVNVKHGQIFHYRTLVHEVK
jgi:hypothetical protein